MSTKAIKVYRSLAAADAKRAEAVRELAAQAGVSVLNIIGSPGCGKTALLAATAARTRAAFRFAVLEGDVATTRDAERLQAVGVRVCQLITDGACHLSAQLVYSAFAELPLAELDAVIIENVGNLVCPACFDVGEAAKVAVLSVTEGEDKPLKYPRLFRDAGAVVVTKIDLLPHLEFDLDFCLDCIRRINGAVPVFQVSSASGAGVAEWAAWVESKAAGASP